MKTLVIAGFDMSAAAEVIKRGGIVAVPTETVYGLAADGLNALAVMKIYEVKNRPETKPISLLVSGVGDIEKYCLDIPESAFLLAGRFWPGPLTIVLKKAPAVPDIVSAGGGTVGLRCPDHPKTLEIIRLAGVPLACPSANMSGEASPKRLEDVLKVFDGKIEAAVDGGECAVGVESTVVDLTVFPPRVLRRGALPPEAIFEVLGAPELK